MGSRYRAEPAKNSTALPARKMPIQASRNSVSGSRRLRQAAVAAAGTSAGNTMNHEWIAKATALSSLCWMA